MKLKRNDLLVKFFFGDMIVIEVKYYVRCFVVLYNDVCKFEIKLKLEEEKFMLFLYGIVFVFLVLYLEEYCDFGIIVFVFKFVDLGSLYFEKF